MVHYNKHYKEGLIWGIESLLGLIFAASKKFAGTVYDRKTLFQEAQSRHTSLTRRQFSKTFYELKRRYYIKFDTAENDTSIKLTNKAKMKIVDQIAAKKIVGSKHCYISFDVPERLHAQRDKFRRVIKRMGFQQAQQSLWVSNKNLGDLVEAAADEYKISDYVVYIVAEASNIDEHLKKMLQTENI